MGHAVLGILLLLGLSGCTEPGYSSAAGTVANSLQKSSVYDTVQVYLNKGDCSNALSIVLPLYNSNNTDNSIRYATASAYGCAARINFLEVIAALLTIKPDPINPASLLFEFVAQKFHSIAHPDDKIPQAAQNGIDVIQSILYPGTILVPSYTVNSTSNNPGSLIYTDRLNDANSYLTFLSMALMGSLESRYGAPDSNNYYRQTIDLPWISAANTVGDGCAYASAVLNFIDGLSFIQSVATSTVADVYEKFQLLRPQLGLGCCQGLQNCGFSISCPLFTTCTDCAQCPSICNYCPTTLRSGANCTGATTDSNSCAAAGMVDFINTYLWEGP